MITQALTQCEMHPELMHLFETSNLRHTNRCGLPKIRHALNHGFPQVEGKYEQKRYVQRGNPAAYHVLVPLNDYPAVEGYVEIT